MIKNTARIFCIFMLLMATLSIPATVYSSDIGVEFGRTHSVRVTEARIIDQSETQLVLAGHLKRPHRLLMAGHIHAYAYQGNGDLITDSKHRVLGLLGLKSKRRGLMRVPFRISIKAVAENVDRVFLEYHSPGHAEI